MVELKCQNCGANLICNGKYWHCEYCHATYYEENYGSMSDFNVSGSTLYRYLGINEVVYIPNGVREISQKAFYGNKTIKTVVFCDTLYTIGESAFENCTSLRTIHNYNSVRYIKNRCFYNTGIKEITIGNEIQSIGKNAFSYNNALETVYYFPNKELQLKDAFSYCNKLREVIQNRQYFFPSFHRFLEVKNNPQNKRPTFADAFIGTPYIDIVKNKYMSLYKQRICPDCGGTIKKGLFHARCNDCGIDYKK